MVQYFFFSAFLGHINLGKKGYRVPSKGTIQVTLFNPLGTVVKMFVVMYDLSDMPPNSQTFLRQRTLYMPSENSEENNNNNMASDDSNANKWLRYLIHLRYVYIMESKRLYYFHGVNILSSLFSLDFLAHVPAKSRCTPMSA